MRIRLIPSLAYAACVATTALGQELPEVSVKIGANTYVCQLQTPTATATATREPIPSAVPTSIATTVPVIATPTPVPVPSASVAGLPNPPTIYSLPPLATRVTNTAELLAALWGTVKDIVIADGVYDNPTEIYVSQGHRLYAEHLGKAVFRAGINIGSNLDDAKGAKLQGIRFDVTDPAKCRLSSVVHVWGKARNVELLDLFLDGKKMVDAGIMVRQPEGASLKRIVATGFRNYGILVDANISDLNILPVVLDDLDVSQVAMPVPLSSKGTGEACIWIGNKAIATRLRAINCAWMGIWTGSAASGSVLSNLTIDKSLNGVGLYLEHFSKQVIVRRLAAGPNLKIGAMCEWADPAWGGKPACEDTLIENSSFNTSCVGVYLDGGTTRTTVRRNTFTGQSWASVGDHKGVNNVVTEAPSISWEHYAAKCY